MASSLFTSTISRSRPTKLVVGMGRLWLPAPGVSSGAGTAARTCGNPPAAMSSRSRLVSAAGSASSRPGENLPEPFVLRQGFSLPAGEGVEAHQGGVGLFVGRLLRHDVLKRFDSPVVFSSLFVEPGQFGEEIEVQPSQVRPPLLRPILEAVPGKELPSVEVDGRPEGRRVPGAAGRSGGFLERFRVDKEVALRAQKERSVIGDQVLRSFRTQRLAGGVEGPTQVVGGGLRVGTGPEEFQSPARAAGGAAAPGRGP